MLPIQFQERLGVFAAPREVESTFPIAQLCAEAYRKGCRTGNSVRPL